MTDLGTVYTEHCPKTKKAAKRPKKTRLPSIAPDPAGTTRRKSTPDLSGAIPSDRSTGRPPDLTPCSWPRSRRGLLGRVELSGTPPTRDPLRGARILQRKRLAGARTGGDRGFNCEAVQASTFEIFAAAGAAVVNSAGDMKGPARRHQGDGHAAVAPRSTPLARPASLAGCRGRSSRRFEGTATRRARNLRARASAGIRVIDSRANRKAKRRTRRRPKNSACRRS